MEQHANKIDLHEATAKLFIALMDQMNFAMWERIEVLQELNYLLHRGKGDE